MQEDLKRCILISYLMVWSDSVLFQGGEFERWKVSKCSPFHGAETGLGPKRWLVQDKGDG